MSELTGEARLQAVAALIEQAPPGEVNDVINSIRQVIADDDALMPHAGKALRAYNLASLTVVQHEENAGVPAHTSILSEAAILPGSDKERYIDPTGKRSFTFDHLTMKAAGYEEYILPEEEESFRAELAKSLAAYAKNHFSSGQSAVQCSQYPLLPTQTEPAATVESDDPISGSSVPEVGTVPQESSSAAEPANIEETPVAPAAEQKEDPEATSSTPPIAPISNAPTESASAPVNTKHPIEEGTATTPDETAQEVQTDLVPEQIGGGADEPVPTPAPGRDESAGGAQAEGADAPAEIIEGDTELEKVDSGVAQATGEEVERKDTPVVEEEGGVEPENQTPVVQQPAEDKEELTPGKREQQRVENPIYTLEVVGNKYKTDAFWTGRWRTRWTVDKAASKVEGKIQVDVHYFEQGNVQLATSHTASFDYPTETSSQSVPSQIVTTIAKLETAYQMELQDVYGDLGEKAFRSLRRALPVTRHKIDWDKVGGYNLRADIGQSAS